MVKDMLLSSRTSPEPHLRRILDCAHAILFLGTPHCGADLAGIGQRLVGIVGLAAAAQTNQKIMGVLQKDSEVLSRIQKGFQELLRSQNKDATLRPLDITCCYEELPITGVGEIVPGESAILHGYPAIGIHADHRAMVRFASADDPGFVSVLGELRRWISQIVTYTDDYHHDDDKNDYDERDKEVWDAKRKDTSLSNSSGGSSTTLSAWPSGGDSDVRRGGGGDREDCRRAGAITIWGNVTQSVIANGNQTIQGNLIFGR